MSNFDIAVIIPTLNEEVFISQCLDSIIKQTYPFQQMDIMVIDGGSCDKTKEIVAYYHRKYKNIRLISNPKKIQSAAFNLGVKHSNAPYIVRLDAHAEYNSIYIETCIELLKSIPNIGNVGGVWDIRPQNRTLQAEANAILNKEKFGIGGASYRVGSSARFVDTVPFGAYPRVVIQDIGNMREDLARGEDNEYNSRIKGKGYKIFLDPRIRANYYARSSVKNSIKQMFSNGISIGKLLHIAPRSVSLRHLIPMIFVSSLILFSILSFIRPIFYTILCLILTTYIISDFIATMFSCIKNGFKYFIILFLLFPCIHIAYGCGTIIGLIKN